MNIKRFVFNAFQVNTYLLYNEEHETYVIDPACFTQKEEELFVDEVQNLKLTLKGIILTHTHIDHILGVSFVQNEFKIPVFAHSTAGILLEQAPSFGYMLGFDDVKIPEITDFLVDKQELKLGNEKLQIFYTPGHAEGSICIYSHDTEVLFSGDVLFNGSIGRTDLPTGNYSLLLNSIQEKLFTLPDNTLVYPGHGESTQISNEKNFNPFFKNQ